MADAPPPHAKWASAFAVRLVLYLLFWIVLAGTDTKDVAAGIAAAAIASWLSLVLLRPGALPFKPVKAALLFLRFLRQSLAAGISVARIALNPAMPIKPGIIGYQTGLPLGPRRHAYMVFTSLLPGTLPTGTDETGGIAVHCLNTEQPVAALLREEERKFAATLSEGASS